MAQLLKVATRRSFAKALIGNTVAKSVSFRSTRTFPVVTANALQFTPFTSKRLFSTENNNNKKTIETGLDKVEIKAGDGKNFPKPGDTVTVHYTGLFTDGKKFDSSRDRGEPFKFKIGVGQVISGWDKGVMTMSVGESAQLICTSPFAYGRRGIPGAIPPNATLVFDVELIKIN